MAYSVISQNNTTTTLADELGNVIHVPARVNLATSTNYTITKVNNNTATLEDENGNIIRDVPCVAVLYGGNGGGGGGAVDSVNGKTGVVVLDAKDVDAVPQLDTLPTASADYVGVPVQYSGATGTYTHGYIYEVVSTPVYSDSVTFEPATISGTVVTATTGALANLCAEFGSGDITSIVSGTMTYDESGGLLVFVGKDSENATVCTFQVYTQDYEDAGFTFTGTLQDGDVIAFTCTITETTTYSWERVDVQPAGGGSLPDQTGQSGKYLTTDGTDASWGSISFPVSSVNSKTGAVTLTATDVGALPDSTVIPAAQVNSDWNANSGVAQILNKPTIPDAIQTDTIPTAGADELGKVYQFIGTTGTYTHGYFYECVSDGQTPATYSWVQTNVQPAGGGGSLPDQTGNAGKFLTTDGTDASWANALTNQATPSTSLSIGSSIGRGNSVAIGYYTNVTSPSQYAVLVGHATYTNKTYSTAVGYSARVEGGTGTAIGYNAQANGTYSVALGPSAVAQVNYSIQLGRGTNSTVSSFAVGLTADGTNFNNYTLLTVDGLIPADRLASTTGLTDGNYRLRLTMADGTPTLSWVAE